MGPKAKSAKKGAKKPKQEVKKVIEMPSIFKKVQRIEKENPKPKDNAYLLEEIESKISIYNSETKNFIENGSPIDDIEFKQSFFSKLESLVVQLKMMEDPYLKSLHIDTVWDWYTKNYKFYFDVSHIKERTTKNNYERHDNISKDKNVITYQASNLPIDFEGDHRTEDAGILPPKERLKDFRTKHVDLYMNLMKDNEAAINNFSEKDMDEKDKMLLSATSGFPMRSTQYTNFNPGNVYSQNSTSSKFFPSSSLKDISKFTELERLREIKSSYGFNRPKYTLENLNVENKFLIEKNRELAEKRNLEEHREFIDKWGRARSQYKESVDTKYDILKGIKRQNYEIQHAKDNERSNLKSAFSAYSEARSEDSKDAPNQSNMNQESKLQTLNAIKIVGDSNQQIGDQAGNDLIKDEQGAKSKVNMNNAKYSQNEENAYKKANSKNKNVQQIVSATQNIKATSSLLSKTELLKEVKSDAEKQDRFPYESAVYLKMLDPVFEARTNFGKFIDVKQIDNAKSSYKTAYTPLSAYDTVYVEREKEQRHRENMRKNLEIKHRPTTGVELLRSNLFNADNLLENRKLFSQFTNNLISEIKTDQAKKQNNMPLLDLTEKLAIPDVTGMFYNRTYLPNFQSQLVPHPAEKAPPKKRPKSKKK